MAKPYIPEDAEWYIAEIIEEFRVEGESHKDVFINFILVHAHSSEQAYERAMELGKEHESEYTTREGKRVKTVFRGFQNIHVIYEKLKHGAEILFEWKEDLVEAQIKDLITPKHELNIFRPREEM